MNVLSLFDGISCARIALERAGINVYKYYASEIDKDCISVSIQNYPDIIQLGDINNYNNWVLPKIDLVIGGSPCQSLSCAGRQKESGLKQGKSILFWKYVEVLKLFEPAYFIFENVASMKLSDKNIITNALNVGPVKINSKLVSAQLRNRFYWTNIKDTIAPVDKNIKLSDILENGYTEREKSYCITATYGRACLNDYVLHSQRQLVFKNKECRSMRKLTPEECEILQTIPVGYTSGYSDNKRYKMIGNAFTVDVITHILKKVRLYV